MGLQASSTATTVPRESPYCPAKSREAGSLVPAQAGLQEWQVVVLRITSWLEFGAADGY